MFGKKKAARTCAAGHPQEETWERCPFCEAEKQSSKAGGISVVGNGPADPGEGAIVVPRPTPVARRLAGWLVVVGGEEDGHDFRVEIGRNTIGKGAECDVVIRDAYVSERHAVLDVAESGKTVLRDLDSKHGTFVDENRVHGERPVQDGDHVRFGHTDLKFRTFE